MEILLEMGTIVLYYLQYDRAEVSVHSHSICLDSGQFEVLVCTFI